MSEFLARVFKTVSRSMSRANRTKYIRLTNRRGNRYAKPHLEILEDRRVLNAYIWNAPATNPFPAFTDPANWTDQATGQTAVTAPDVNTDCYFTASSPTLYPCYTNYVTSPPSGPPPTCRSINTDVNWHGDIHANVYGLHVYGGNSVFKGGTITTDVLNSPGNSAVLEVSGGTFDYDAPDLNQNANYPSGTLEVYIGNGATFTVDKDCFNIGNSSLEVGINPGANGSNSPGTLIYNTITPGKQYSQDFNSLVDVYSQGTLVYNPGAHVNYDSGVYIYGGTAVVNSGVNLSLGTRLDVGGSLLRLGPTIQPGLLQTVGSGSAVFNGTVQVSNGTLQMSSDQGNYFHLEVGSLLISLSTFEFHVDGGHPSTSDTITANGSVRVMGGTSFCHVDGMSLSPGDHQYMPITSNTSFTGAFTVFETASSVPLSISYTDSGFKVFGTGQPLPPPIVRNFVWSPTTTDTNWSNPNNWTDSVTGLRETNAPGPNDDVVFGATSPTRCDLFTNGTCQTITTDSSWNGHIVLHNTRLSVYGVNAPAGKSSVINGGAIDVVLGGTVDEIGGVFDYAVSELGAGLSGFGRLNVAIENSGKFIVDRECQTINACFFVGQSYPSINPASPGILEFDTTDPTLTYSMSVRSVISVSQKGIVNFTDGSVMSGLALVDYGTVNLGTNVVLTTPTMGLLHAILVESGGILNTAPTGAVTTINGDLNVLGGGTLRMNGDGAGLYSALVLNGTLTVGGIVDVGFDVGYFNGSAIQANQTNILQGSTLSITTEGTPQPAGFPYLFPVIYGPITGSFSTVAGVTDPITFNDGSELVVEWLQA